MWYHYAPRQVSEDARMQTTRKTKQREALREALESAERPLSVVELLDAASKSVDGLGVATVYRAVSSLLDEGVVTAVAIPGNPLRYELASKEHHHHFQCEKCARVFDLAGCVENLRKLVPPKFRVRSHDVTLYGLCARCAR
jgi:Fur family transcriptional regulator, ferric uptake regulator